MSGSPSWPGHPADPLSGLGRWVLLAGAIRRCFEALGWSESPSAGGALSWVRSGWPPARLVLEELPEAGWEDRLAVAGRAHEAELGPLGATLYLVLVAPASLPRLELQEAAARLSRLGRWRRTLLLPLDLEGWRLLDGHLPPSLRDTNRLEDPLLNLGALLGRLRRGLPVEPGG